ncbi:MAG: hypothetical protein BJ554DRAFT_8096, partial [Olpidium bornovanus]
LKRKEEDEQKFIVTTSHAGRGRITHLKTEADGRRVIEREKEKERERGITASGTEGLGIRVGAEVYSAGAHPVTGASAKAGAAPQCATLCRSAANADALSGRFHR